MTVVIWELCICYMARKKNAGLMVYAKELRAKSAYVNGRSMVSVLSLMCMLVGVSAAFFGFQGELGDDVGGVILGGLVLLFSGLLSYFLGQAFFDIADAKLAVMEKERNAEARARKAQYSGM